MRLRKPAVTAAGMSSQNVLSRWHTPVTAAERMAGAASPRASPSCANCLESSSSVSSLLASESCRIVAKVNSSG